MCTKNNIKQKFWAHLISVMIVAFAKPRRVRSRFIEIKKVRIYFYYIIFKVKTCFFAPFLTTHTPNNVHFITYYENNVQSPIRTYSIIALHEHEQEIFTCLNCIRPIKFHFATLNSALSHAISL